MISVNRCAAFFAALFLSALTALAQDITLTARDGGLTLSGTLQSYDGEFFRVMSDYGPLTVDAEGVICEGPACPDLTAHVADIRILGEADAGRSLLPALIRAFAAARGNGVAQEAAATGFVLVLTDPESDRPVARFIFSPAATEVATAALRQGAAQFALATLPEPDLGQHGIGAEALVAVVAPDNPLPRIATADLARALSGEIANWQELGGPDMPLVLHALRPEAGFRRALENRLGQTLAATVEHAALADLAAGVARDPWALTVTAASASGAARVLTLTDSCGFVLAPDTLSVKAADYPLTQVLYLLTPKRRLPLVARAFLDFLTTPAAQTAVAAAGFIDRSAERAPLLADGQRLANAIRGAGPDVVVADLQRMALAMAGTDRLSLTFRFEDGSRTLDAPSRENLADLARLIEIGRFDGQEIVLAGFSDGSGDAATNLDLSHQRAESVLAALGPVSPNLDGGAQQITVDAFGELLPMACDTNPIGRRINRRVEVWLRPLTDSPAP